MLFQSLTASTLSANAQLARENLPWIDGVELRADLLSAVPPDALGRFPQFLESGTHQRSVPVILTIRRRRDGGKYDDDEGKRLRLLQHAVEAGNFSFVDLEEDLSGSGSDEEVRRAAYKSGTRVIRSFHSFDGTGGDLSERLARLSALPGEIPRIAVEPRSTSDLLQLVRASLQARGERIVAGMGDYGFPLRILSPVLGNTLAFCSHSSAESAEGGVDPRTMQELYRYSTLNQSTAIYAVIGNPIMHSRSPAFHNSRFAAAGMNAVYVPIKVDSVSSFFELAGELGMRGVSVTIPHKEAVIPFLKEVDESVTAVGACNTIIRDGEGYRGTNTDVDGFLTPLAHRASKKWEGGLAGRAATVIGAGGASRAVIYALIREGVNVCVLNRTESRARAVTEDLSPYARNASLTWGKLGHPEGNNLLSRHSDIIIQTTSLGMHPDTDGDPLPEYRFHGHELVYDIVYNPPVTRFLSRAAECGCEVIQGGEMFEGQALLQAHLFQNAYRMRSS